MPFRYTPIGAALQHLRRDCRPHHLPHQASHARPFHASRVVRSDDGNPPANPSPSHYEALNVDPDASHADIKKSFYALSKAHHPDHNPSDPHAPRRFMRISEAYSVLSHADKRARYDRDVLRRSAHHQHTKPASYHSSNPAGGRPPSGLSKRRGTFTGPPPSFFRSGGWGAHGAKRRAAHEESTGGSGGSPSSASRAPNNPAAHTGQTTGEGGNYMGRHSYSSHRAQGRAEAPHFDHDSHHRTQQRHDVRRAERAREMRGLEREGDPDGIATFLTVAMILAATVVGPWVLLGMWAAPESKVRRKRVVEAPKVLPQG
ncbi:hypothetical protein B0H67DRAFT_486621 [Lasiosphaeris hirsuta]|uniref:J domain-containing protein n=1 Tax=Lasiosphaeris hirsuta TaxID=260670 RepID=A0AA40DYU0_9PEZI|nr:hypothetical protein B0H67DRAFT_486621 [Lasiosphaeris hirsuta]